MHCTILFNWKRISLAKLSFLLINAITATGIEERSRNNILEGVLRIRRDSEAVIYRGPGTSPGTQKKEAISLFSIKCYVDKMTLTPRIPRGYVQIQLILVQFVAILLNPLFGLKNIYP